MLIMKEMTFFSYKVTFYSESKVATTAYCYISTNLDLSSIKDLDEFENLGTLLVSAT